VPARLSKLFHYVSVCGRLLVAGGALAFVASFASGLAASAVPIRRLGRG
jgi:hypothetical protein